MCAGVSTFNVLRKSGLRIGDVAAVQGVGGLGHLAIQFAAAGGFETVAISRGTDKREAALEMGADHYVDATATAPAEALLDLDGASVVVSTAPSREAIEAVLPGLGLDGRLYPLGVPDEGFAVDVVDLIENQRSVHGHSSGTARESQDALEFCAREPITPTVETYPLDEAETAHRQLKAGDVTFRAVLVTGK